MTTTSVIELKRSALANNLDFIRNNIHHRSRISSVVKGNAYGHGIKEFVSMAESEGIDHFSVFSADEAERVFKCKKPETDIMIMGWLEKDQVEWAIENNVEFYVFDLNFVNEIISSSKKVGKAAKVHIELETGMNRTGFKSRSLNQLLGIMKDNRGCFEIKGICTHYAGAESIANYVRIQKQIRTYNRIYRNLVSRGIEAGIRHTACSAAAMNYPGTCMDMVRIGIMQYGLWPSPETFIQYAHKQADKTDPLTRVLRWKSKIMTIKEVKEGEFISYGTNYLAQEDKKTAIIPVGYSSGYSRILSNQGRVLINETFANVIGLVNMNMMIVDVSLIPSVKRGDEVVLIGKQGDLEITVNSFSAMSDTMNYELLVRLPQNIERKIVN
ncbi:MAG TPA: alanine racemase [Bacteroidetes bacterium]|nr:alanine racemase [Bacteroidota bacterium]